MKLNREEVHKRGSRAFAITAFFILFTLMPAASIQANQMCKDAGQGLQASFDTIQGKGGLWGLLESVPELRDRSFLGLQADSKLQKAVVMFQNMCEGENLPKQEMFDSLQNHLGDGRMVFNLPIDRTPPDKFLEQINAINKAMDEFFTKWK